MPNPRHALGQEAEATVARWLADAGWTIVGHRVRSSGGGEVDIVALDPRHVLVAIEVRARRSARTGVAAASLDGRRVARVRRTLASVAATTPHRGLRVDLVTVEPARDGSDDRWLVRRLPAIDA